MRRGLLGLGLGALALLAGACGTSASSESEGDAGSAGGGDGAGAEGHVPPDAGPEPAKETTSPGPAGADTADPGPAGGDTGTRAPAPSVEGWEPEERGVVTALAAAPGQVLVGGALVEAFTYDGVVPGPTLRGTLGETLEVTFTNGLEHPTTIHWHGVHVPWAMDGVTWMQDPIEPGGVFTYTYELTRPGTFWFHPHFDTERQVDLGLFGVLVVEDPDDPPTDAERVLVFDLWGESMPMDGSEPTAAPAGHHHAHSMSEDWLVNAQRRPVFSHAPGTTVRARLLNASNVGYLELSWPGQVVLGHDQGLLPSPEQPESLLLAPGDRAEVLWTLGEAGFVAEAAPWTLHGGSLPDSDPFSAPIEVFEVVVEGQATYDPENAPTPAEPDLEPWTGAPHPPTADPGWTDIVYVFSGSPEGGEWLINGELFPDITIESLPLGSEAIVEVRNLSPSEHPFHLHGHSFELLSVDGEPPAQRTLEDTLNVPIYSIARLLLHADNPGDWMAHCHILPHASGGMMTVLRVEE